MEPDRDLGATLQAETIELPDFAGRIVDLDLTPEGRWVALVEHEAGKGLVVRSERGRAFTFEPTPWAPGVRVLPDDRVMVFDGNRRWSREENARIFARDGRLLASFGIGSDLTDAIVLDDLVVFGYGDQGGYDQNPYEKVFAAFDFQGNCLWRCGNEIHSRTRDLYHVYAMCRAGPSSIWAQVYGDDEFDFVRVDLQRNQLDVLALPGPLSPAQIAIDPQHGGLFRNCGPEGPRTVFRWTPWHDEPPEPLGDLAPFHPFDQFRATPDGRSLLHIHDAGYTVWSF